MFNINAALFVLAISVATGSAMPGKSLAARQNPDFGVPNARCLGGSGDGKGTITCPDNSYDVLCSKNYMREELGRSNAYCITDGGQGYVDREDGKDYFGECYCTNGNFCCENSGGGSTVPGGQRALEYYQMQGCSCEA
jgi:hypothetical protein